MKNHNAAIFQHDVVNDLAFAIFSDASLNASSNFSVQLNDERLAWLTALDKNPSSIKLAMASKRLGHYYEALWGYFLQEDPAFEVIASQLQIHGEGKTYGEFDFLLFDTQQQRHLHLEIAIKFYMYVAQTRKDRPENAACWLGPNSRDNLARKQQHMQHSQQALSQVPAAKKRLAELGINTITAAMSLKGYLFSQGPGTPANLATATKLAPYYFADNCQQAFKQACYLLPKQRWLSPVHQQSSIQLISFDELQETLKNRPSPVLLCHAKQNEQGLFIEQQRFFICPNTWPNTKR